MTASPKRIKNETAEMSFGKMAPQAVDLEEAILGALLVDHSVDYITQVKTIIAAEDFYKSNNAIIYEALLSMNSRGEKFDILTVTRELKKKGKLEEVGGPFYVSQLASRVTGGSNIMQWCGIVKQESIKRQIIVVSTSIARDGYDSTTDAFELLEDLGKKLETIKNNQSSRAKKISIFMEPSASIDVLRFKSKRILSAGNISALVAPPGTGKSSVCEAIACGSIYRECDSFGFGFTHNPGEKGVLYVDTERSSDDVKKGMRSMGRRVMINKYPSLIDENGFFKGMDYVSMIEIPGKSSRQSELELLIKNKGYKMVILDGITDFIRDANDAAEAADFISWMIAVANSEQLGFFVTIHDNPVNSKDKPRGHIGSELYRKCESLLIMKKAPEDNTIRVITSDFAFGKNRNDSDTGLNAWVQWNDEHHQMREVIDFMPSHTTKSSISLQDKFQVLFASRARYKYKDLCDAYAALTNVSVGTAKRLVKEACDMDIIIKDDVSLHYMLKDAVPF